ncbi:FemAB-related protein, PEP-CTERM system-associated [Desulfonatronum thiosulfatophilum]|uniref:FemAB-related protein, PEP-CTERM system-associated n=2 Tax=Desulfonatronum thiosulfatophilum TaxID=617002 RepID=A0A1G6EL39_9BACT|nr:FemAB-related protein, PEP-CTERM system-associated [Desulfonatronum thiosulfatophilum]
MPRRFQIKSQFLSESAYPAWDRYVLHHEHGSPYLTTAWKKAVQVGYGHKTSYLAAFSGSDVVGSLPLVTVKPPLVKNRLVSLPFCDFGGLLADDPAVAENLLNQALKLAADQRADLEIRCPAPAGAILSHGGFIQTTNKCRMLLALPSTADELWSGFKSKLRSQINRAEKNGLTCRLGGSELLNDFYQVFTRNMRDLGSPVHGKSWLTAIIQAFGKQAVVGVVYAGNSPAAAGIILCHGRTVSIPWASALREFNRLSPNMLLYWTFLKFAADSGCSSFDFGRSTPGEGTYSFKKQWGAAPAPLAWYRLGTARSQADEQTNGSLRRTMESVWKCLPLPAANILGPCLRKYIDR